jgi:seryl-tRNA synthetase
VLTEGSPEEVVKMDAEREQLKAELKQIEYQELRLRERLKEAEAEEARKSLPGRIKGLPDVLDRYEEARAAMQAAERELNDAVSEVGSARQLIGEDAPAVDENTVERIAEARGLKEPEGKFAHSSERAWLYKQLTGQLSPRLREEPETPSSIRRRERFGRDERDDRQRRRQPENSIWRKKDDAA